MCSKIKVSLIAISMMLIANSLTGCESYKNDLLEKTSELQQEKENITIENNKIAGLDTNEDKSENKTGTSDNIPVGVQEDSIESISYKNALDLVLKCNDGVNSFKIQVVNKQSDTAVSEYNIFSKTEYYVDTVGGICYMENETADGEKSYIYINTDGDRANHYSSNNKNNWVKSDNSLDGFKCIMDVASALKKAEISISGIKVAGKECIVIGNMSLLTSNDSNDLVIDNSVDVAVKILIDKEKNTIKSIEQTYNKEGIYYCISSTYTDYDSTNVSIPEDVLKYFIK